MHSKNAPVQHILRALLLTIALCLSPVAAAQTGSVRVVTWNIEWFPGRSPSPTQTAEARHHDEVADYLPSLEPDILVLQEIRDEQAARFLLDTLPGVQLHVVSAFVRPDTSISQQIVIGSRYPVSESAFVLLEGEHYESEDFESHRGFAFAALESPFGGTLLVYGLHLKSNWGERDVNVPMRESAAHQIVAHMESMQAAYQNRRPIQVIAAGDFNVLLDREEDSNEKTIDIFLQAGFHSSWQGVPFADRITWPPRGRHAPACFDYILTKNFPPGTAQLMPKPAWALSDHRPVLLELPLP
jgi:endonuclease/exonuclease/phosphatase family metal-dependent hydrolase